MGAEPVLSRCPHCGARGVKIADQIWVDGVAFNWPFCGICGKNWPRDEPPGQSAKVVALAREPER